MIFTKNIVSTSYNQIEKLTREFNIKYRACIGSLIYFLSRRVDLSFEVHKLAKFSSNHGKVNFEGMVHFLRKNSDNKTFGVKYYAEMKDVQLSDLLRQASIKTDNQLVFFYDSSWKYRPDTGTSTGAYMIIYQGGTIGHNQV